MSTSLLNKSAVKKYILEKWQEQRSHEITRVSAEAYNDIEAAMRRVIDDMIQSHPSVGKTFKP